MSAQDMQAVSGRDIAALLNPRPLVLVGACASEEADFATVAWAMPVSHNPAMFAFALRKASRTFSLIEESNACSISTFDAAGARVLDYCGTHTGWKERKADAVDHVLMPCVPDRSPDAWPIPSDFQADFSEACVPVPTQALSTCLCKVDSITEAGDHMLVCVRVLSACSRCGKDDAGRLSAKETLLCLQRDEFVVAGAATEDEPAN